MSNAVQPPAKTPHRPVCQQSKQPAPNLLQLGRRPDGIRRPGCDDDQLGRWLMPPHRLLSSPESWRRSPSRATYPDHSQVASSAVVPEISFSPGRRGGSSSSPQGPHLDRRRSPSSSSGAESDCMVNFIRSYTKAGLSREAAAIAGEARRPSTSTRRTYNTHIRKYSKWCRRVAVNPHSTSPGQVCDFLTSVFKEEGATAYSVRSCRTAVAAVHHGFGEGNTVSNSPAIHDLIKGMFHQRPPFKSLVPVWDLRELSVSWQTPHLSHFIKPT